MEPKVKVVDVDEETVYDLFSPCRECTYWECPEAQQNFSPLELIKLKAEWFKKASKVFGSCGKILYVGGKPVAYCQFGPSPLFENLEEYSKLLFPLDDDAVVITCLYVKEGCRGRGLGSLLLREVLSDLRGRGVKAVETYSCDDSDNNPSGPTRFYLRNGFKVLRKGDLEGLTYSLVRLEL